jgi:hypothetical protein
MARRRDSPAHKRLWAAVKSAVGKETEGRRFKSCRAYFRERTGILLQDRFITCPVCGQVINLSYKSARSEVSGPT